MNNGLGFIGLQSSGVGIATVDGAGSIWNNNGALRVGSSGQGTLNITGGGVVNVGTDSSVNSVSAVYVGSGGSEFNTVGSLTNAGLIDIAAGGVVKASVVNNSGRVHNNGLIEGNFNNLAGGTLSGSGTILGDLNLSGILAVGNSPGTMTVMGNVNWNDGTTFELELSDATGTAGSDPGWDLLLADGVMDLSGVSAGGIAILLTSLDLANIPGMAVNFNGNSDYHWIFATADGGITGFDSSLFTIDSTNFWNSLNGMFAVSMGGDSLFLDYTTNALPEPSNTVPEPASLAIWSIMGLGAVAMRRRSKRSKTTRGGAEPAS